LARRYCCIIGVCAESGASLGMRAFIGRDYMRARGRRLGGCQLALSLNDAAVEEVDPLCSR
jgi:hypothetical protein